jgi:diguanylate cyclase (GGDEF)-like protein
MTIYLDDLVVDIAPMPTTRRGVSTHAVVATDALGRIRTWDAGAAAMFGCSSAEMLGRQVAEAVAIRLSGSTDAAPVCHVTASAVIDDEGALQSVVWTFVDERQLERTRSHHDEHDELTGLANRRAVEHLLQVVLSEAQSSSYDEVAVLFVDVDRFATVNDAWGHAAGDLLLAEIAERLRGAVGADGVIARFGGDEFVVVCEGMSMAIAESLAARIHRLVSDPVLLNGERIRCTVSVGVALSPSYDASTLLRDAAAATADAKSKGRNCTRVYDADLALRAQRRLNFASELRDALAENRLELHYQPVLDVGTGGLLGVEALSRWVHPVHGNVAPAEFLRLAEETGLMTEFDNWVLRRACAEGARLLKSGVLPAGAFIAVNVAERSLADQQLSVRVTDALVAAHLPASNLVLEVTETGMLANPDDAAETMRKLRLRGVGIALDDFGTGHASLAHLRKFPLTALKVERAFIEAMSDDAEELTIVAAVIDLARALGVTAIAEGVETRSQLELLRRLGCPAAQGFLWSEALSPADLTRLLMRPDGEASRALSARDETRPHGSGVADDEVTVEHGLRRLLQLHQEGQSSTTIAAALNAAGYRTPSGQRWHQRTVARALARLALPTG